MSPTSSNRGSALLTVLWLTAALSAVGLAVAATVRGETERTATGIDDTRAYFLARGAIERAALHISWRGYTDESGRSLYYAPGQPRMVFDFPDGQAVVDIIPAAGKLNPNIIRPEDLLRLLLALGTPADRATEITSAIIDWRSPLEPGAQGPFDGYYLSRNPSFLARHASFTEDEELLLTKGVTPELYYGESLADNHAGLRDCLSVYGSAWGVDVNSATAATLQAVGISPGDARALVARRATNPILDYAELASLQQAYGEAGQRLLLGGRWMFTLRATARLKTPSGALSDLNRTAAALISLRPQTGPNGFDVLRWYDRD